MSKPKKNKPIKPLEGYTAMSDDDVASIGTAVVTGLNGNSQFPTLPVDLATLKANIESFRALIVEALAAVAASGRAMNSAMGLS